MATVALDNRKTKNEVHVILQQMQDTDPVTPELLIMIDYAYHNTDNDYDDGLSILDRLHRKLSIYFPIQWNVPSIKDMIRTSQDPATALLDVLNEILTEEMIACYGV